MNKPSIKIVQKDDIKELIKDFSESEIAVSESDISRLINEKSILLIEAENLDIEFMQVDYDDSFKCCLVEAPENTSLMEIQNVMEVFPTDSSVFGLRNAANIKVKYIMNKKKKE